MIDEILGLFSDEELLIADGFDDAIIGVDTRSMRLIYSVTKCYDVLMERDGMEFADAVEYFDYNVEGAYVGEKTPIWCYNDF
tara:strand:- start:7745 stop:7990 length:246 start_codon:yes stop_codon:yes gene_type:complete